MSGYASNNSSELLNSSFEGDLPIAGVAAAAAAAPMPLAVAAPIAQNARPQLNERLLTMSKRYPSRIPAGTFSHVPTRKPLHSKIWGNAPFFKNAKPASMLERGYVRSMGRKLVEGEHGLFTEKDGIEREVRVIDNPPDVYGRPNYTFITVESNPAYKTLIYAPLNNRFEFWDFYTHTAPVAFVPRPGSLEAASIVSAAGGGSGLLGLGPGLAGGAGSLGLGGKRKIKKTRKNKLSKKSRRRSK